jgi:hypothetical protein
VVFNTGKSRAGARGSPGWRQLNRLVTIMSQLRNPDPRNQKRRLQKQPERIAIGFFDLEFFLDSGFWLLDFRKTARVCQWL